MARHRRHSEGPIPDLPRPPAPVLNEIREAYLAEFPEHQHLGRKDWWEGFRLQAERSLYTFAKYVLGMRARPGQPVGLSPTLHRQVCDWIQCVDKNCQHEMTPHLTVHGGKRKLLMLPVAHLKTSIVSHALPLHMLVQPQAHNIYFPGMAGADSRILLHGETVDKARENLGVVKENLERNEILRWLWPQLIWREKKEAPVWKDDALTVRRSGQRVLPEPSITAIGVRTALEQRHFDGIIMDDLATLEAAQSETMMNYAKLRRKACRSRLDSLRDSMEIGVGTHWTATDVYVDWKRDPSVEVCIRAAIEDEAPIWPEKHPLEELLALQAEEQMGKVLFSANYMNQPLNPGFSALDWQEIRAFTFDPFDKILTWDETLVDRELEQRNNIKGLVNANLYALHGRSFRGMPLSQLYRNLSDQPEETREQRHQRRLARVLGARDREDEGSATWMRLNELAARKQEDYARGHNEDTD